VQELHCAPLFLHSVPCSFVHSAAASGGAAASGHIRLIDNSKGAHPLDECRTQPHCIYLASAAETACAEGAAGRYKSWTQNGSASLLVLPFGVSRRAVTHAIADAFAFYNDWSEAVLQRIRTHDDWFAFIELAHEQLQNPMLIYDSSMKVLAYTRTDGSPDALWRDTIAAGAAQIHSAEESTELMKYIDKMERCETPFLHRGKAMSDPFYSCNIMANGRRIGMVTEMEHNHPVTQGQLDLLWNFAALLSIQMQQEQAQQQNVGAANRQLIQDLLDGTISSPARLATRLVALHWQVRAKIRILQWESALPYMSDEQWQQVLDAVSTLSLHGIGSLLPSGLLFILSTDSAELSDAVLEALRRICERFPVRCGVSDPFDDLLAAHRYRRQPELALKLSAQPLCFYAEVRFADLCLHLRGAEHMPDLLHPAVARLKELDETTHSAYISTLRALFENQYSQVNAALSLGIHRTTLFYRLQKIEELTGIHLNDPNEMLHIQISLMAMGPDTP
jgi:sugar diacid utilization regulator